MHFNLDQATPGGLETHARVCILGAGIAGLILARTLAERKIDVILLEAGGLELEHRSQSLYEAEMPLLRHAGATEGRFRVFGGSSTRWGGQLLPYTEDIFQPLAGMPSRPWPIEPAVLARYYPQIEQIMRADHLPFGADLLPRIGQRPVDLSPDVDVRFSKWAPFGSRNLANSVGRDVLAASRIRVLLHANVTSLESNATRSAVVAVRAVNYGGIAFRFTADHFVVALGTIESSRLMLLSGLGNDDDQVGRFFHDHIGLPVAELAGDTRRAFLRRLGPFLIKGTLHTCKMEASAVLRARHSLLAVMAHVTIEEPEDSGASAIRNFLRSVQRGDLGKTLRSDVLAMLRSTTDIARLLYASKVQKRRAVTPRAVVRLKIDLEQIASARNRIRLSKERDALNIPKAAVDWTVNAEEFDTIRRFARLIKPRLLTAGFPPANWLPGLFEGDDLPTPVDTYHAMGGLQMGTNSKASVVTPDLKVHGIANLSVASCAVYPSGGSSNPTFTLMALTLRLADRISSLTESP